MTDSDQRSESEFDAGPDSGSEFDADPDSNPEPGSELDIGPPASIDLVPGELVMVPATFTDGPLPDLPEQAYDNLLVVITRSPASVEAAVVAAGGDPSRVGIVPVMASMSNYAGPCWIAEPVSPSDPTRVGHQCARGFGHLVDGIGWVVIDGLGTMLMYANDRDIYRLVSMLATWTRERRLRGVTTIDRDVISETTIARFRSLYDRFEGPR